MKNEVTYGRYKISLQVRVGGPIIVTIFKRLADDSWDAIKMITLDDPYIAEGGK